MQGPSHGGGSTHSISFSLPAVKGTHDATCTLGIFQHNCLKITRATTARFLFRKGFGSPACPGSWLRKWRLGQAGPGARAMDWGHRDPPLLRPGSLPVTHLPRAGQLGAQPPPHPRFSVGISTPWAGPRAQRIPAPCHSALHGFSVPQFPHLRGGVLHYLAPPLSQAGLCPLVRGCGLALETTRLPFSVAEGQVRSGKATSRPRAHLSQVPSPGTLRLLGVWA